EEALYHYNYDKKGHRVQCVSNLYGSTTIQYVYDKKHRLIGESWVVNGIQNWMNALYTYDAKSLINSYSEKYIDGYADNMQLITYDKRGNLKKVEYGDYHLVFTNTYKNGRLVKRLENGTPLSFKYKKISVDRKLADRIEQQQWRIINNIVPGNIE
ncbi:MAG: hypothetical protein IJ679_02245, partial [Lachnospiraceae bacterium]|nr:hypothetical protein [Lachnospiraceae bacterium]